MHQKESQDDKHRFHNYNHFPCHPKRSGELWTVKFAPAACFGSILSVNSNDETRELNLHQKTSFKKWAKYRPKSRGMKTFTHRMSSYQGILLFALCSGVDHNSPTTLKTCCNGNSLAVKSIKPMHHFTSWKDPQRSEVSERVLIRWASKQTLAGSRSSTWGAQYVNEPVAVGVPRTTTATVQTSFKLPCHCGMFIRLRQTRVLEQRV